MFAFSEGAGGKRWEVWSQKSLGFPLLHGREAERRTQAVSTSPMPLGLGS